MADDEKGGKRPGRDSGSSSGEEADYSEEELASFGKWVPLGAKDPAQQPLLDIGLSIKWERREPSGSPWVFDLIKNPIPVLMREKVPGLHPRSRLTTTILHHHRGLETKIIRIALTVEQQSGDAHMEIDKETEETPESG
jgi:hypothetical protein